MSELDDMREEKIELQKEIREIEEMYGSEQNKVLEAIDRKRWFHLKGKNALLFDKQTAYLWNSNEGVPYDNGGAFYGIEEGRSLVKELNLEGITQWNLPDFKTFDHILVTFPYRGMLGTHILLKNGGMQIEYFVHTEALLGISKDKLNDSFQGDLKEKGAFLAYNDELSSEEYVSRVAPNHPVYTKRAQQQTTIDLLVSNRLQLAFEDPVIENNYYHLYYRKPELEQRVLSIDFQMNRLEMEEAEMLARQLPFYMLAAYRHSDIMKSYNNEKIQKSPVQFADAVESVSDYFLNLLNEYELSYNVSVLEYKDIRGKMAMAYEVSDFLTEEENAFLRERTEFLASQFTESLEMLRTRILEVKVQGTMVRERLVKIQENGFSFQDLHQLNQEERVDFSFLVENLVQVVQRTMAQLYFFGRHTRFFHATISAWENFEIDYKMFKEADLTEMAKRGKEEEIATEVVETWQKEWTSLRYQVETMFMPLVQYSFGGALLEGRPASVAEKVFFQFFKYKGDIDRFYLKKLFPLYEKYKEEGREELRVKLEMVGDLFHTVFGFEQELCQILLKIESTDERQFLIQWAEPIFHGPMDEVINYVEENCSPLSRGVEATLAEFGELKHFDFQRLFKSRMVFLSRHDQREQIFYGLLKRLGKELEL